MHHHQESALDRKHLHPASQSNYPYQRVFVTDAQGHIEQYFIGHLLHQWPQVEVLGVGRSRQRRNCFSHVVAAGRDTPIRAPLPEALSAIDRCPRYSYRPIDIQDKESLRSILSEFQPDLVIHLGTSLRDFPLESTSSHAVLNHTVGAAVALLETIAACQFGRPKIVLGSTSAVYGHSGIGPVSEDAPLVPVDLYGAGARAAEEMTRLVAISHQLPVIWARIFQVLGPGQSETSLIGSLVRQVIDSDANLELLPTRVMQAIQDAIDVRDVAQALRLLAESGQAGQVYNVGSGCEVTLEQMVGQLSLLVDLPSDKQTVELNSQLNPSPTVDFVDSVAQSYAEIGKLSQLGFSPRYTLAESLKDILHYYQKCLPISLGKSANQVEVEDEPTALLPLSVQVEETHTYPVLVSAGLLDELPSHITRLFPGAQVVILTDERVHNLYGQRVRQRFMEAGIVANPVLLAEGELAKSMESYHHLIQELYRLRFDRRALLVCLGGGVISDVGGFVAATYMRGVAYVNVPTTLLAQNDAAIGGKVAVNMPWAKNFVGAFHHPQAVFCDPLVLATQDQRNLAAGIAESIKVAICGDPNLFVLLEQNAQRVLKDRDPIVLGQIVHASAQRKIALLHPDPYEVDLRRVLNLGHSFGHALEVEMEFEGLLHGEAVAWGLIVATTISVMRGICAQADAERIYALLLSYGLPPRVSKERLHKTCQRLQEIRLVRGQHLHFVLPTSISTVHIVPELEEGEIDLALNLIADHPVLTNLVLRDNSFYPQASQPKVLEAPSLEVPHEVLPAQFRSVMATDQRS